MPLRERIGHCRKFVRSACTPPRLHVLRQVVHVDGAYRVKLYCGNRQKVWSANDTNRIAAARAACMGRRVVMRQLLPNRRPVETFVVRAGNLTYTCSAGRFDDGRLSDIFLSNHKSNSAADTNARDSAIVFSFAVQHGADAQAIRDALCRDSQGHPSGPLGAARDILLRRKP